MMCHRLIGALALLIIAGACNRQAAPDGGVVAVRAASCVLAENAPVSTSTDLTLQLPWFANGEHSYAYLGRERGIFATHGFNVTVVGGRGSELAARSVAAGSADAAIVGGDAVALVAAEGGRLLSIGAVYQETPVTIYSLTEKGIDTLEELQGRRVGLMPGSNTVIQYEGFAAERGLNRHRVDEVNVPPPQAGVWLLNSQGRERRPNEAAYLDALVHYTQFEALRARMQVGDENITEIRLSEEGVQIYGMTLSVAEGRFNENQLMHLRQAVYDSFMCARQNPEASIDALAAANPDAEFNQGGSERAFALRQLQAMFEMACKDRGENCENFLEQNDAYWQATLETLTRFQLLREPLPLERVRLNLPARES